MADEYPCTSTSFKCVIHGSQVWNETCKNPIDDDPFCDACTANPQGRNYKKA